MVGLGSIGQRHLRNIRRLYGESVEIMAYRVRGLQRTFSDDMKIRENVVLENEFNIKSFSDLDQALLEHPDIAFITNITSKHIECAIKCAEAGCHLFIEKPLSFDLNGVKQLQQIVKAKNLVVFMGFQNRYHPCVKYLKNVVENNELGDLIAVNIEVGERLTSMHRYENYADTYMARKDMGGGIVLNQLIHEIDYITDILGAPSSVYAVSNKNNPLNVDVEDNTTAIYDIRGIPVCMHCDFMQFPPVRRCKVIGSKDYITIDLLNNKISRSINDEIQEINFSDFQRNDMFIKELEEFMDCVSAHKTPNTSLHTGINTLTVALATISSIKENKPISIQEVKNA